MSEQVIQGIVMFLVGSCCTYFLEKWTGVFSQNSAMKFALQALLLLKLLKKKICSIAVRKLVRTLK